MLKVQLISDMHHEFKKASKFIGSLYSANKPDVLVLAGDIDKGLNALTYAAELVTKHENLHVIIVPGNHEYYNKGNPLRGFRGVNHEVLKMASSMQELRASMFDFVNDPSNSDALKSRLHLLDNETCVIGGVRFIGSTFWTDFELFDVKSKKNSLRVFPERVLEPFGPRSKKKALKAAGISLNDFNWIKYGDHVFTPEDSLELHQIAKAFILDELNKPFEGKTVLVLHHLPSEASSADRFKKDIVSACFASNLDDIVSKVDYCLHGHTHDSFCYFSFKHEGRIYIHHVADFNAGVLVEEIKPGTYGDLHVDFEYLKNSKDATLTLCNPHGYMDYSRNENSHYDLNLIIEI